MKRSELKKLLKPLIKECIQEALLEEGVISVLIKEIMKGTDSEGVSPVVEADDPSPPPKKNVFPSASSNKHLAEAKKRLLKSIGGDVDVFEGTTPLPASSPTSPGTAGALSGVNPNDSGVDISSLAGNAGAIWKRLSGDKK